MAIIKTGILFTNVEGSIGNVTVTRDAAGRNIARQKVTEVSNPRSVGQVNQREKFAKMNELATVFQGLIPRGWRKEPNRNPLHTPRNRFMSYNLLNAFTGAEASTLDLSLMKVGEGNLQNLDITLTGMTSTATGVEVTIDKISTETTGNANVTDRGFLVLFNEETSFFEGIITNRSAGTVTETFTSFGSNPTGTYYLVYGAFVAQEFTEFGPDFNTIIQNLSDKYIQSDWLIAGEATL